MDVFEFISCDSSLSDYLFGTKVKYSALSVSVTNKVPSKTYIYG
jgi:hypothetical protein